MQNKIKLLDDLILIKRDAEVEQIGSIIIPRGEHNMNEDGTVVAVGPGKVRKDGSRRPMDVKIGDRVRFNNHQALHTSIMGENLITMHETDLLFIIDDDEAEAA